MRNLFLCVISGLLLALSWPATGSLTWLVFIAFIPLFFASQDFILSRTDFKKAFGSFYLAFLIFNIITTWWVYHASGFGVVIAIVFNSLFMTMVYWAFHQIYKRSGGQFYSFIALIAFWISFEKLHMYWDISWPWLTLGNVFAAKHNWVQWYEYTGHLGGSLWVLLLNALIFETMQRVISNTSFMGWLIAIIVFSCLPIMVSYLILNNLENTSTKSIEVVVVQPNIDPYYDKFSSMSSKQQVQRFLDLAKQKITPSTQLVVGPETAVVRNTNEQKPFKNDEINMIEQMADTHNVSCLIGINSYRIYQKDEKPSNTSRAMGKTGKSIDFYNTAAFIEDESIDFYHKSKLVPGVEKMPLGWLLKPIEKFAINLGGTTGSLGIQENRNAFSVKGTNAKVAPIICYESIYGSYVGEYIQAGANILAIITNDGWWKDTPGYHQHLDYARLRAIEHRREIIRSANTGISCFIDQKGEIDQPTNWWVQDVITREVKLIEKQTFYSRFGDYVAFIAIALSFLMAFIVLSKRF